MQIDIYPEIEEFIEKQNDKTIAKILKTIDLLEKFSYNLRMPYSKKITNGIYELRINQIRLFYTFKNYKIIMFYGIEKKTNKIPKMHMETINKLYKNIDV